MNWINRFFLALVMLPSGFYKASGIDTAHLRAILTYKLIMDDRRPNSLQAARQYQDSEKEINFSTIWMMLASFFMGAIYLIFLQFGEDYTTKFTLYFSLFLVFLCMTLVSDFTSVLIDVRDTYIILPKPVNDRSFVAARLLHVFIYVARLVTPMVLPCVIYLAFMSKAAAIPAYLILVVLLTLLAIFLINAVYIVILRVTTPERFKTIINYFQIAFAIFIYAGYHFIPRMLNTSGSLRLDVTEQPWLLALPPYWFGSALEQMVYWNLDGVRFLAASLAIVIPLVSVFVVIRYLAPAFNQKLAMVSGSDASSVSTPKSVVAGAKPGFLERISSWVTSGNTEQAGFLFTWKMMARSRDFKLRAYPSIGYFVVMFGVFFYKSMGKSQDYMNGYAPIGVIYFSTIVLFVVVSQFVYSEKYKASWVFLTTPVTQPGHLLNGAIKAVFFQFLIPILVLGLSAGIWAGGIGMAPSLLLAVSNLVVITYLFALIGQRMFSFSLPISEVQKGGKGLSMVVVLICTSLIALIQYYLLKSTVIISICLLLSVTTAWLLGRTIRNTSWATIRPFEL